LNDKLESKEKSRLEVMIERVVLQAVSEVFGNIIPPAYKDLNIADEIRILCRASMGTKKRPWENVFIVGLAIMQKDMTTVEITKQLNCNRSTAYRIIKRLETYGFVERLNNQYTLSERNCPLLYYLCRRRKNIGVNQLSTLKNM